MMSGSGSTFYDWTEFSMTELYHDFCVPIFSGGNAWSCQFLNTGNVSYLLPGSDRPSDLPACCIFEKPWVPPNPDFMKLAHMYLNGSTYVNDVPVTWWRMDAMGGFGVAWSETTPSLFTAFYFAGVTGYTEQNFYNIQLQKPPASTWQVPSVCHSALACDHYPPLRGG
jgi:hypothetical protein